MKSKLLLTLLAASTALSATAAHSASYFSCVNDDLSAQAEFDAAKSYIKYEDYKTNLLFETIQLIDGQETPNPNVELKETTDIGFIVKDKTKGGFLVFRERELSPEQKTAGFEVQYHMQGLSRRLDLPDGKSAGEVLVALAQYNQSKIDVVLKCKRITHPIE